MCDVNGLIKFPPGMSVCVMQFLWVKRETTGSGAELLRSDGTMTYLPAPPNISTGALLRSCPLSQQLLDMPRNRQA